MITGAYGCKTALIGIEYVGEYISEWEGDNRKSVGAIYYFFIFADSSIQFC